MASTDLLFLVVGISLLVPSVIGPVGSMLDDEPGAGGVEGYARFRAATYSGEATVTATEAVAEAKGSFSAQVEAGELIVTVYEYRRYQGEISAADWRVYPGWTKGKQATFERYDNATIHVDPEGSGRLLMWPNGSLGPSSFQLTLAEGPTPKIFGFPYGNTFWAENGSDVRYEIDGPLVAVADGVDAYQSKTPPQATLTRLAADGGVTVVVDGSSLEIEHARGSTTVETGTWESDHGLEGHLPDTPATSYTRRVFATVDVPDGNASIDLGDPDARALFLSQATNWSFNGTLQFDALDGQVRTEENRSSIDGATVRVVGNTSLHTQAEGVSDDFLPSGPHDEDIRRYEETRPPPTVQANFESDARHASVDGQALSLSPGPPIPEETTIIGQLLGSLMLAWTAIKHGAPFAVGLLAKDPLEHPRRRKVYELLENQGLAHLREIHRTTEIPIGSLNFHLRVLESAGLVRSVRRAGYKVCFPSASSSELDHSEMERLALLASRTRRTIVEILCEDPEATQSQIAERLGVTQGAVSQQLSELVGEGLLKEHGGRPKRYQLSPSLEAWIDRWKASQG